MWFKFRQSHLDIGIDLGTANSLVYVRGKGIIINEPSVVAVNEKTNQILAIGTEAKRMVGRTPGHIVAIRPLVEGVVSDFEVTQEMLRYFINKAARQESRIFPKIRVVIGVPSGVTEVEKRAVEDAAKNAGAKDVYLVEEPMSAAIGSRLDVQEASGHMIVDIGGGTTEVAMISLGGIVSSKSLRIAGDKLNEDIINYTRINFNLLLGERTAEDVKIKVGSAFPVDEKLTTIMRGRDLITGLPKEMEITSDDVSRALSRSIKIIVNTIKEVVEETPPELLADIMEKGIIMAGGGSLLRNLNKLISDETKVPVIVSEDPLTAVVRGTGIILENISGMKEVLLSTLDGEKLIK